ncbi:MAG: NAD(P)H-hydrate dehydratase [Eubacteriales bacterium]|nr:NAD(P)H-hydrate dehydratase [Eubacteriales bacterium]MDY3333065.1 NAD(P)H-hydrate dehydratase [Gallibacter sp.]
MDLIKRNDIILKERDKNSHKGNYGKILVVAGSVGMAGAAVMCGNAVIKSGSGLVTFAVPKEIFNILQVAVPEAMCLERDFDDVINMHRYDAIALGSGIGQGKENISIIKKLLNEYTGKLIIDADGLNCIMKYSLFGNVRQSNADIIMTPHLGEAARLLEIDEITEENKNIAAKEIQEAFSSIVVMKGANTVVVSDNKIYVNNSGNPGMATAGAGDVLTGIITSLAGQGYNTFNAAKYGVFIHGLSGDICAQDIGQIGMTAMDIMSNVPKAFKLIQEHNKNNGK